MVRGGVKEDGRWVPELPQRKRIPDVSVLAVRSVSRADQLPIRMPNLTKSDTNDDQPKRTYIHRKPRFIHNSFASIPGS